MKPVIVSGNDDESPAPSLRGQPTAYLIEAVNGEQLLSGKPNGLAVLKLVQQKQRMLKDAWLTTTGHKRPGMNQGLPLEEAQRRAKGLETKIDALAG